MTSDFPILPAKLEKEEGLPPISPENSRSTSRRFSAIADNQFGAHLFNQARFAWGHTRIGFPEHPQGRLELTQFYAIFNNVGFCQYSLSVIGVICASPTILGGVRQPVGEVTIHPYSSVGVSPPIAAR